MSTRAKPEVGGPYRRKLRFEEAVDRDLEKKPLAQPIDRSGLVAINSYKLGYLRDSMDTLAQREMEMELHEAVKRHLQNTSRRSGIPMPTLQGITRQARQVQRYQMATPRGQPGFRPTLPSTSLAPLQTVANPVGRLAEFARAREEAAAQEAVALEVAAREQQATVDEGLAHATSVLGAFPGVIGSGIGWGIRGTLGALNMASSAVDVAMGTSFIRNQAERSRGSAEPPSPDPDDGGQAAGADSLAAWYEMREEEATGFIDRVAAAASRGDPDRSFRPFAAERAPEPEREAAYPRVISGEALRSEPPSWVTAAASAAPYAGAGLGRAVFVR